MIIMYNLSLTFTKLSILLQYKRLFPQKGFKLAVHVVMGVVVIYALWRFFSAVFTCAPVQACELFFLLFFLFSTLLTFWGHGAVREEYEEDEDTGKPNADRFAFLARVVWDHSIKNFTCQDKFAIAYVPIPSSALLLFLAVRIVMWWSY